MSILHTVNKSPFERANLTSCLAHAQPGDALLLIEDGVYAAVQGTDYATRMAEAAKVLKVSVLGSDLKARGHGEGNVIPGISIVDYAGFVDLAAEASSVNAWL